jgi:hypothetical protein
LWVSALLSPKVDFDSVEPKSCSSIMIGGFSHLNYL